MQYPFYFDIIKETTGDTELLMSAYHQDADYTFTDSDGIKKRLNGIGEINEHIGTHNHRR